MIILYLIQFYLTDLVGRGQATRPPHPIKNFSNESLSEPPDPFICLAGEHQVTFDSYSDPNISYHRAWQFVQYVVVPDAEAVDPYWAGSQWGRYAPLSSDHKLFFATWSYEFQGLEESMLTSAAHCTMRYLLEYEGKDVKNARYFVFEKDSTTELAAYGGFGTMDYPEDQWETS